MYFNTKPNISKTSYVHFCERNINLNVMNYFREMIILADVKVIRNHRSLTQDQKNIEEGKLFIFLNKISKQSYPGFYRFHNFMNRIALLNPVCGDTDMPYINMIDYDPFLHSLLL